ncbi:MAG: mycothiol transferase [Citricoccus sp.]
MNPQTPETPQTPQSPQTPQTPLPAEPAESASEIQMLTEFLDYYRAVLRWKAEGLTAEQLRRRTAVSTMTLGGLLHHLDYVEDEWFGTRVAGEPATSPWDQAPWLVEEYARHAGHADLLREAIDGSVGD